MATHVFSGFVREVPLEGLRVWEQNPRRIAPERLEELKRALVDDPEMLLARPLLALPDGTVFAGNQRLRAARELGWETLPVYFVDLEFSRAQMWALRDNNQWGEWDEPSLAVLLAELEEQELELVLAGFSAGELDRLLAGVPADVDPDAAPPLPRGSADSQAGEIYPLGKHRLFCGDAADPAGIERLVDGQTVEAIWTDPPYGVEYVGKTRAALRIRNDSANDVERLLGEVFSAVDGVFAACGRFYVAAPAGPQGTVFRVALERVGWRLHQGLVWMKDSPVLGHADHHFQHEDVLYGWKPGPGRPGRGRHRGSRWYGDNRQTSVFLFDRPTRSDEHPTMKPVGLIAAMLANSTRRGDCVLDPFAGSGSTLIACEQLGRRCFAAEIDPRYCDVIRRRYTDYCHAR